MSILCTFLSGRFLMQKKQIPCLEMNLKRLMILWQWHLKGSWLPKEGICSHKRPLMAWNLAKKMIRIVWSLDIARVGCKREPIWRWSGRKQTRSTGLGSWIWCLKKRGELCRHWMHKSVWLPSTNKSAWHSYRCSKWSKLRIWRCWRTMWSSKRGSLRISSLI